MANYVERFTTWDRVLHWLVALSFFVLVFSGLGLYARSFFDYFRIFGGPHQAMLSHKIAGIVFFFSSVLLFFRYASRVIHFDADDRHWLARMGGYLSRHPEEIPQGQFNAGQKLFSIGAFLATLVMGVTGVLIWDPTAFGRDLTRYSLMLHSLVFIVFIMGVIVHVYLGTIGNPGTLEGMLWGRVRWIWAKKHHIKWFKEVSK
jgi:formate dehydrogenase subunit gamma